MAFETRYCAFVDVLGFKNIIQRLRSGAMLPEAVLTLLKGVYDIPLKDDGRLFSQSDFKFHAFSDNVCLSARCNADGLSHILHSLEGLTLKMLDDGVLLRGAIVKGSLHHDDQVVFGDALVKAYELESQVCVFPRIMLERAVAEDARSLLPTLFLEEFVQDLVLQSDDGPFFLNVLVGMNRMLGRTQEGEEEVRNSYIQRCNSMVAKLQERFDESVDNPRHFEKVKWFAKYWNDRARRFDGIVKRIEGPGLTIRELHITER